MDEIRRNDQCIERCLDASSFYSVSEYEDAVGWAQRLSSPKARSFHGVIWTEGAPAVEELTVHWQDAPRGRFRICDWDAYDAQMRVLIGLE